MAPMLALLSSFMWGTGDFFGGTLTRRRPALAVVSASQAAGFALVLVIAVATGAYRDPLGWLPWSVGASVTGFTGLLLLYAALAEGTMGIVSPVAALGVLVPLAVGLLAGDVPAPVQLIGIVLAVVGLVLASGPELSGQAGVRPVMMALGAAVMFGVAMTFIAAGSRTSVVMTMTGMRGVSTLIALGAAVATRSVGGLRPPDVPLLVVVGGLDVLANLTYGLATTLGLLAIVAVLGSLYPVFTVVLAAVFHHERMRAVQYAGVTVALLGVALISAGGL
jgi:drug/metabolite transporter (DMT)-like permease